MVKKNKRQRVNLPPELPPELPESDIEFTEEDLEYVKTNPEAAEFLSTLDAAAITSHVTRVANANGRTPEELFEERERRKKKRSSLEEGNRESGLQNDIVDALPVKTLDGRLQFRTMEKKMDKAESMDEEEAEGIESNKSVVKLSKAEKRAKMKKMRKEAKKQGKPEEVKVEEEIKQSSQAEVLAEVQKELTAEEEKRNKQTKLAELGMGLLADPEKNIKCLKEMLKIAKDTDQSIVKLAMLSLLAVFKDIIPGYRIRLPTEKEMEMTISKAVKNMRYYESTLLSSYKAYLQKLILLEQQPSFQQVAVRCVCTLLDAVPHFNFRDSLLAIVVRNIGSPDAIIRKLCCETVKSLFTNEGKHGGEATVEAVQLIANLVKAHNCQLHPDSIEVFLCLSFDEDLGKPKAKDGNRVKYKKSRRKLKPSELKKQKEDDRKRSRKESMEKTQQEVEADFKAVSFTPDVLERRNMQTETLSAVFETYFRILKHTMQLITDRSEATTSLSAGTHPLLDPCLNGLGKFSHLIDLDYMSDLMKYLKNLASGGSSGLSSNSTKSLSVSECLRCCIVAFKVMRSNLDALNVDLQDFSVQLYNLILEYRPRRDQGDVLAEALKIMLCDDRQHDMLKAAAFIKRLATFSLCFGCAESMAALVTLKHLLQKNVKCRNLLENDAGGGSVSGSVAKYHPYATDPNLSGALASVLWELDLLRKHYDPSISTLASSIAAMSSDNNQVYLNALSPQQAYKNLLLEQESFNMNSNLKINLKRKRGSKSSKAVNALLTSDAAAYSFNENEIRKKLSEHFAVFQVDIDKNDEQYRKPKKKKKKAKEVEAIN